VAEVGEAGGVVFIRIMGAAGVLAAAVGGNVGWLLMMAGSGDDREVLCLRQVAKVRAASSTSVAVGVVVVAVDVGDPVDWFPQTMESVGRSATTTFMLAVLYRRLDGMDRTLCSGCDKEGLPEMVRVSPGLDVKSVLRQTGA